MIFNVKPVSLLKGTVQLPASKSYSIRAFLAAACGGTSKIINPSECDDAVVARKAARSLGAKVTALKGHVFSVTADPEKRLPPKINVKESGTVLRLILPLAALRDQTVVLAGEGTLRGRPNHLLTQVLRRMGAKVRGQGRKDSVPIRLKGGTLHGGSLMIDATLSSQFISALLMACPQLEEETTLLLKGKRMVSGDYIRMTLQVLKKCGITIKKHSSRKYVIKGQQHYKGLKKFKVPSDYGLAAFFMAAAALVPSDVTLKGSLNKTLVQADGRIVPLLKRMGVTLKMSGDSIRMKGPFDLRGGSFSLKDCPDLLPILAVTALFAGRKTRFYNIAHARVKESDRISDLCRELHKVGADVKEKQDELIVNPVRDYKRDCLLDPYRDHRLAMAFSVLGLKLGARVKDIKCTSKSYPGFVRDLRSLTRSS